MSDEDSEGQQSLDLGLEPVDQRGLAKTRGIFIAPKVILASALFTTRNNNQPRELFKNRQIAVAPGFGSIRYQGEELRYNDMRVWQSIIELSRIHEIHRNDHTLKTTIYELLMLTGWKTGGQSYLNLKECLQRLKATSISFVSESGDAMQSVSLIARFAITERAELEVSLDPEIYKLFHKNIALLNSKELNDVPALARKVFEIIKADPSEPLSVAQYMELSGNKYKLLRQFKAKLIPALNQLKAGKFIANWEISKNNLVIIQLNFATLPVAESVDLRPESDAS